MKNSFFVLLTSIRPRQWLKNVVVFAPLVFATAFFDVYAVERSILAFILLCLLASGIYLINDICDKTEDGRHPAKRARAIASGQFPVKWAIGAALTFIALGFFLASLLNSLTLFAALGFVVVNIWYSYGGKCVPILDVMLIGVSFVMRVLVGAAAISVPASMWLLLTLFFLATYLGFTKRDTEFKLKDTATRISLTGYTAAFLDHARSETLIVTLALYTLYSFSSPFGSLMALTVPPVFFGLMRYQAIVDTDTGVNDGPSDHIYEDRQLQAAIVLWGIIVLTIVLMVK
ncbi:UbiA family prenyltransferase [Candidatus Kaiserbacteria bacterium]|nr:UbiA family prenyltransferase [Candidatus Kaiserbacteria bacterium]